MKTTTTISKKTSAQKAEDYNFLREQGLQYIEQFTSDLWTDYNSHDPGITMLEAICYAITDLGHRTSYSIPDILATKKDNQQNMQQQFLTAAKVLPSSPVTELDYRKLFIDIPEVKNAWLNKASLNYKVDCKDSIILNPKAKTNPDHQIKDIHLNGLYDILLELDENLTPAQRSATVRKVRSIFHRNRNLCEDLNSVSRINQQAIMICAELELTHDADIETVWAQIFFDIEQYLTPNIKRYSVKDLIAKGKSPDEIFNGPLLEHGFFDDDELNKAKIRDKVFISDLMRIIMGIPGVEAIREIFINYANPTDRPNTDEKEYKWCLDIKDGHQPILDFATSTFNFYKDLLPFVPFEEEMKTKLAQLHQAEKDRLIAIAATEQDLSIPLGTYRNIKSYTSIQNDFPETYRIGQHDLPTTATKERIAKAKQLKAYLLFFDQILANYFAQLSNLKHLLSPSNKHRKSYFIQVVSDIKGIEDIYMDADKMEAILPEVTAERNDSESSDIFTDRKNQLLDHLLARFAESFSDYALLMHRLFKRKRADRELIRDKISFLKDYQFLSKNKAKGFDYCNETTTNESGEIVENKIWYTQEDVNLSPKQINVSGIIHRAARLAGIHNYKRRNLAHIDYDIYEEKDEDGVSELRWRVLDIESKKIILSSSTNYDTPEEGEAEMRKSIGLAVFFENYELLETIDGRFYFNIIDKSGEVVARRIEYFATPDLRLDAIEYLIDFLNEKYGDEGFYAIENILLRPRKPNDDFLPICTEEDCKTCATLDPYSFRVNIVFPGYTPRFSNLDFRNFMERIIRSELPAHILARICWIGEPQMEDLETRYRTWLEYQQDHCNKKQDAENDSLNQLVDLLGELFTVYPPGTLHDCIDGDDENPIILGRTHIGNQEEIIESDDS